MDSASIRANMSAQHLIHHEVHHSSSTIPDGVSTTVTGTSSGSSSLSSSNSKLEGKMARTSSITEAANRPLTKRQIITVSILCFVNLINYMDRYTIAGILTLIQCDFKIGDTEGGLLQTAFVAIYMIAAPIFGYLGDRYSRKLIMAFGIFIWSLTTLLGSFMTSFWPFLAMRALVGVGEASYSTIAPTIISDLFVGDTRSKFLALFYFAIPVGSGLGYIVGSEAAKALGSWHWGLRMTPIAGAVAVLLIVLVVQDPPRGESEGSHLSTTSWWDDIKSLAKNKSFVMSTAACTAVAFVAGALAWWGPKFIMLGLAAQDKAEEDKISQDDVSYIFGLIAMLAGLIGVPFGSFMGQKLRGRYERADPIVCGMGLLFSTPLMLAGLFMANVNTTAAFAIVFFGQLLLNLNWSIVADILLYTVIPTRRSTAEAFQILFSHALGDAGSPYLVGQISEVLKTAFSNSTAAIPAVRDMIVNTTLSTLTPGDFSMTETLPSDSCNTTTHFDPATVDVDFKALQYAMIITIVVELLGAFFFFATAWYIVADKATVDRAVSGLDIADDDERRALSPSKNRRRRQQGVEDGASTPEEDQPITIKTGEYRSVDC